MWTDRNGNVVECNTQLAIELGYNWNCINCINCHNCINCTNCINCINCHNCINCTNCTDCINCHNCHKCHNCHNCHNCINCNKQPICIITPIWVICIRETTMQIGCQNHDILDWMSFDEQTISLMHPEALIWWQQWKPVIQAYLNTVN